MKRKAVITSIALAATLSVAAIPAKRGPQPHIQPDGSTVTVELVGDEFFHYYMTSDSVPLMPRHDGAMCYARIAGAGSVVCGEPASDRDAMVITPSERKALIRTMLAERNIKGNLTPERAALRRARAMSRAAGPLPQSGMGLFTDEFVALGSPKALVVLVEYQDVKFDTQDAHGYFDGMLNERGFSRYGGTGCATEYFEHNSGGLFTPQFDLYGPVTLPYDRAYYGSEYNENGQYLGLEPAHLMVRDAVKLLDNDVDFSQYDTDGNGFVDNIFIIYAGEGEASSQIEETVWPHQWNYSYSNETPPRADGVYIDHYACANEIIHGGMPDGVGTFIHEFSHVMGLPDLYNTDDAYAEYTPGAWSCLDYGPYNNNGRTPPLYSAYERNALGWFTPEVLDTEARSCSLESLDASGRAFIIQTDNVRDFFLIENRQRTGWDICLPGSGMLVWHIDATTAPYSQNVVNNTASHQYVDILEANNRADNFDLDVMAGYTFPGPAHNTSLSFSTKPALKPWSGTDTGIEITDIAESSDGLITFNVNGGEGALHAPVTEPAGPVNGGVFTASWQAVDGATDYLVTAEALTEGVATEVTCDFGSGNTLAMPEGWTSSTTEIYKSTSVGYFGKAAPAIKLGREKNTEHFVQSPVMPGDITSVSFWYRGASTSNGSSFTVYGLIGDNLQALGTVTLDGDSTGDTYTLDGLPEGIRAIRIVYTKRNGNLAVDDIVLSYGGPQFRTIEGYKDRSTGGATRLDITFPQGVNTIRYAVRATDGVNVSRASDYVTVTDNINGSAEAAVGHAAISIEGRTVTADGRITVCDLAGRTVVTGHGRLTLPAPGAYIISTHAARVKAIIR